VHRYFIRLSYNGTRYHGWQLQPNATTVQQVMGDALSMMMRTPTELTGCGRTDTGVHAEMFFAHFETSTVLSNEALQKLKDKLNVFLDEDIYIEEICSVAPDTHAPVSYTHLTLPTN
jgi:tRNA pseudouridine38-40 synthase